MRSILLVTLMTAYSLFATAQTLTPHNIASAGHPNIGFYDFKPSDYTTNTSQKLPLIIALHGRGEKGDGTTQLDLVFTSGIGALVKRGASMRFNYPTSGVKGSFLVLLPQLSSSYGDWQPFYVEEMIKWAKANLNVDTARIFITGYSLGGGGTWVYPASSVAAAQQIAGVVPVSGTGLSQGSACNIAQGGTAVWAIHTSDDDQVSVYSTIGVVNSILACGPKSPVVGWYPVGNHQIYDQKIFPDTANRYSYPTVYQYMLGVNRKNTPQNNKPPVANVGATDTTVVVTSSMMFYKKRITAEYSTDPNDLIVHYNWQITSNNLSKVWPFGGYQPIDTSTAWPAHDLDYKNFSWPWQDLEFHALGDYTFKLTVTDMFGATSTQTKTIHITNNGQNTAPVVNLGPDLTLASGVTTASFIGTKVFDWEAQTMTYKVTQESGPITATLSANNWYQFNVSGMTAAGTYVFKVAATDAGGATGVDYVSVVQPQNTVVNKAPVAKISVPSSITLPSTTLTLDGTASSDSDGTISSYLWTQTAGPNTATIATPSGKTTLVSAMIAGTYTFQLKVTDNQGATGTATATVVVKAAANVPPVAKVTGTTTITLPTNSTTLDGSTSTDSDGSITAYRWYQASGPNAATIATPAAKSTVLSGLIAGSYRFVLSVTDNQSATDSVFVTVTVNAAPNVAPVAKITGTTTIQLPTNSTTLDGSTSTDSDGSIAAYLWTQTAGPNTATIATSTAKSSAFNGLIAGTYTFQLKVTDNLGATGTTTATVVVNAAANVPPVAKITGTTTITLPTNSTTLDGSTSTDNDGSIAAYLWTQTAGPNTATIATPTGKSSAFNGLIAGTYTFQLKVTDNLGATGTTTATVVVNAASTNKPPVANADKDFSTANNYAYLSAGASYDPDGSIAAFDWIQVSGPNTAKWIGANTMFPTVQNLIAGVYVFKLTVTDNLGATASDDVQVTVTSGTNQPPVAKITGTTTIQLPTNTTTLDGSTSTDSDGSIAAYLWTQTAGPNTATIATPAGKSTAMNGLVAGSYTFQLKVTDNLGATGNTTVTVTVNAASTNKPPVASTDKDFTTTNNYAYLSAGGSYDLDGSIVAFAWTQVSGPNTATWIGANTMFPTVQNLVSGVYVFKVTVTDNMGATSSASVQVTVNLGGNKAPIANAGADFTVNATTTANLSASGSSDPDGTIASYKWTQVSGPNTATIVSAGSVSTAVQGLVVGVYVFKVTVTDNLGATATDDVQVTVTNVTNNKPPVANADKDFTTANNYAYLSAGASYDPDGSIVAFSWIQLSGPNTATWIGANTMFPTVQNLVSGVYVFKLTVTDNLGATSSDDVQVTVGSNKPPVASADKNFSTSNNYAYLSAGASYDPDGTITAFQWTQVSGPNTATWIGANTMFPTVQNLITGAYVFRVKVTDNAGASSTADVTVTVTNSAVAGGLIAQTAVGGLDTAAATHISIYPNPATTQITVSGTNNFVGNYKVMVYDATGRVEAQYNFVKPTAGFVKQQLDISRLPIGVHYVETIYEGNQHSTVQKFMKQ